MFNQMGISCKTKDFSLSLQIQILYDYILSHGFMQLLGRFPLDEKLHPFPMSNFVFLLMHTKFGSSSSN